MRSDILRKFLMLNTKSKVILQQLKNIRNTKIKNKLSSTFWYDKN